MARFGRTQPHSPIYQRPPFFPPRLLPSNFSESVTVAESFAKLTTPAAKSESFFVADGYQNLFKNSSALVAGSDWAVFASTFTPNATTAPDGSLTALQVFETATTNFHGITPGPNNTNPGLIFGTETAISWYAKPGPNSRQWCRYRYQEDGSNTHSAYFDIVNGVVGVVATSGTGPVPKAYIAPAPNGFWRCTMVIVPNSLSPSPSPVFTGAVTNNGSTYLGDVTFSMYFWGPQFEYGHNANNYVPTGSGQQITGFMGLVKRTTKVLVETFSLTEIYARYVTWLRTLTDTFSLSDTLAKLFQRILSLDSLFVADGYSNFIKWSQAFTNALWGKTTGVTVTDNFTTAPDGTQTAGKVVYDGTGTSASFRLYQFVETSTANQPYTGSIWLRADSPLTIRIINTVGGFVTCNLTTSWQRFQATGVGNGVTFVQLVIYSNVSDNSAFTIYVWGAQEERTIAAGNYIATTGSTVTGFSGLIKQPLKALIDTFSLADAFSRLLTSLRPFADTFGIADTLTRLAQRTVADSMSLLDTLVRQPGKKLIETCTPTDTITFVRLYFRTFFDTLTITERFTKLQARILAETLAVSDTLTKVTGKALTETVSLYETIKEYLNGLLVMYMDKYSNRGSSYGDKYNKQNTSYGDKYNKQNSSYTDKYNHLQ